MADTGRDKRAPARTLLEARIRDWNMTYDEFSEYAETFARDHGEPGTLSTRQLQRLAADSQAGTRPRPATRRLLERIFNTPADALLAAPTAHPRPPTSPPRSAIGLDRSPTWTGKSARHNASIRTRLICSPCRSRPPVASTDGSAPQL